MATKAQKRARNEAKHAEFMEEIRQSGLKALAKERARRQKKLLSDWQENHDKNHSWKKLVPECPHCQIMKKNTNSPSTISEKVDTFKNEVGGMVAVPATSNIKGE